MAKTKIKPIWIVAAVILFIMMQQKGSFSGSVLNGGDGTFTGQFIGAGNGQSQIQIFQLPQGFEARSVNELKSHIAEWNTEMTARCTGQCPVGAYCVQTSYVAEPGYCGCNIDFTNDELNKLYNFDNCAEVKSVISSAIPKLNSFKQSCGLFPTDQITLDYQDIKVNGKDVSMVTYGPVFEHTASVYGYCNEATNRFVLSIGTALTDYLNYYSSRAEPSTLSGYVSYLYSKYDHLGGNTGDDVCRVDTDCETTDKCVGNFCVPKETPICNNGESSTCTTTDNCAGTKSCVSNNWGTCVKTDASCTSTVINDAYCAAQPSCTNSGKCSANDKGTGCVSDCSFYQKWSKSDGQCNMNTGMILLAVAGLFLVMFMRGG